MRFSEIASASLRLSCRCRRRLGSALQRWLARAIRFASLPSKQPSRARASPSRRSSARPMPSRGCGRACSIICWPMAARQGERASSDVGRLARAAGHRLGPSTPARMHARSFGASLRSRVRTGSRASKPSTPRFASAHRCAHALAVLRPMHPRSKHKLMRWPERLCVRMSRSIGSLVAPLRSHDRRRSTVDVRSP